MIQFQTTQGKFLAVDVPSLKIDRMYIAYRNRRKPVRIEATLEIVWANGNQYAQQLPPATYTIIGIASELTELEWYDIVDNISYSDCVRFRNYLNTYPCSFSATASGLTLIAANNIPTNRLILKIEG